MAKQNNTKVVTGIVRLSYANIWDPKAPVSGGDPRYSCSLIIPKSDTETVDAINRAIDCAIQEGIGKFGGTATWSTRMTPTRAAGSATPTARPRLRWLTVMCSRSSTAARFTVACTPGSPSACTPFP